MESTTLTNLIRNLIEECGLDVARRKFAEACVEGFADNDHSDMVDEYKELILNGTVGINDMTLEQLAAEIAASFDEDTTEQEIREFLN